ncbi:hypothetical protein M2101_002489, partial [Parabacteroides sp. PM5-20]|uniref:hypothetical protein n=1 Tax=Parabacteroides sp. PM5-20 TaxID=2940527 RepID=UPI0024730654
SRYPDTNSSRWRLWCMMLLALLATNASLLAQDIEWSPGSPSMPSTNLTVYGANETLSVSFMPTKAVTNGRIVFTLPAGVKYASHTAQQGGTPTLTGQTGQTVTFIYSSWEINQIVTLDVVLKTDDKVADQLNGTINIAVKEGSTTSLGAGAVTVQFLKPQISITSDNPTLDYTANTTDPQTFELKLLATEGKATSFQVILKANSVVELEKFKVNGTPLGASQIKTDSVTSLTTKTYTLTILPANIPGGSLGQTTPLLLTFDASSFIWGTHTITTESQYPESIAYTTNENGVTLSMIYPQVLGAPTIFVTNAYYITPDDKTVKAANWEELCYDGESKNIYHAVYKNTGADAYNIKISFAEYYSYSYFDIENITYQIGDGAEVKLKKTDITGIASNRSGRSSYANFIEDNPYAIRVNLPVDVCLPKNETLTLKIPVISGKKVYDNSSIHKEYTGADMRPMYSAATSFTCVSKGNSVGTFSSYSFTGGDLPYLSTALPALSLKTGASQVVEFPIMPGTTNTTKKVSQEVFVRMPKWLSLKNTSIVWKKTDGTTWATSTLEGGTTVDSDGYRTYSWKVGTKAGEDYARAATTISLTYEASSDYSSSDPNQEGEITYWTNYQIKDVTLPITSRRYQKATLMCKREGVELDEFYPMRKTFGLVDSNDDGIPDVPHKTATTGKNDLFLVNDLGDFVWKATVLAGTYNYLYLPMTLGAENLVYATGRFRPETDNITLKVQRGDETFTKKMNYTQVNTYKAYVYFHEDGFQLKENDKLEIYMPFVVGSATMKYIDLTTSCFVSENSVSDPFAAVIADKKGEDKSTFNIESVTAMNYTHFFLETTTFSDNISTKTPIVSYSNSMFQSGLPSGGFVNEYRLVSYMKEFSMELPDGYEMTQMKITLENKGTTTTLTTPTPTIEGNRYTYNVEDLFNADGSGGKMIYPEEGNVFNFYPTLRATQAATYGKSYISSMKAIYRNFYNNDSETVREKSIGQCLNYTGISSSVIIPNATLTGSSGTLSTQVSVGNPNDF